MTKRIIELFLMSSMKTKKYIPSEYILPLAPLSVNQAFQGRRFKTQKYNDWLENGLWLLKKLGGSTHHHKPYNIEITLLMSRLMDIDNPIKMILDLLKKAGIIEDDRYVDTLFIKKIVSKNKMIKIKFL